MTDLRRDRLSPSSPEPPTLTAAENITLPSDIAGRDVDKQWFEEITTRLGLAERLTHRPAELSGGQQQRVACARALVSRPDIIFGDEPTGNLDSNSAAEVLTILRTAVDKDDQTVVIVTTTPRPPPTQTASSSRRRRLVNELIDPTMDDISPPWPASSARPGEYSWRRTPPCARSACATSRRTNCASR